jgi:uncharacterized protein YbjT (DUF2867 family)
MARLKILVTGASGYIGGSLVPRLLQSGYPVRVLVRNPNHLQWKPWRDQVEVAQGDVLEPETLPAVLAGIDVAYYFIHSLYAGAGFHDLDLIAARSFAQAAQAAGVQRIIYLGGLGDPSDSLSEHLRSRQLTGAALRAAGVPVTEFRAAVIIGAGSASFEMIRYLTERIPPMICPRWVFSRMQPIAIDNVLDYLVSALEVPASSGQIIEIGGADTMTYGDTMMRYARARGLRRWLIPVPLLTPGISSHWVAWVTPVSARIARPLIEGLRNDVVVTNDTAQKLFPHIHLLDYDEALRRALADLHPETIDVGRYDAAAAERGDAPAAFFLLRNGLYMDRRYRTVDAPPEEVYRVLAGLGGKNGWLYANWAWRLRWLFDRLLGSPACQDGRADPNNICVGDALDFLRVVEVQPGRLLRLHSEVELAGRLWIQFESRPRGDCQTRLVQTIFFAPKGLLGLLYWYLFYPLQAVVFSGLIREIGLQAERICRQKV